MAQIEEKLKQCNVKDQENAIEMIELKNKLETLKIEIKEKIVTITQDERMKEEQTEIFE